MYVHNKIHVCTYIRRVTQQTYRLVDMVEYVHIYILQGEAGMCTKDVERRKAVNLKIEKKYL